MRDEQETGKQKKLTACGKCKHMGIHDWRGVLVRQCELVEPTLMDRCLHIFNPFRFVDSGCAKLNTDGHCPRFRATGLSGPKPGDRHPDDPRRVWMRIVENPDVAARCENNMFLALTDIKVGESVWVDFTSRTVYAAAEPTCDKAPRWMPLPDAPNRANPQHKEPQDGTHPTDGDHSEETQCPSCGHPRYVLYIHNKPSHGEKLGGGDDDWFDDDWFVECLKCGCKWPYVMPDTSIFDEPYVSEMPGRVKALWECLVTAAAERKVAWNAAYGIIVMRALELFEKEGNLAEAPRWIPVSERLPPNHRPVIARRCDGIGEDVRNAYYIHSDKRWYRAHTDVPFPNGVELDAPTRQVTHWIPYPTFSTQSQKETKDGHSTTQGA